MTRDLRPLPGDPEYPPEAPAIIPAAFAQDVPTTITGRIEITMRVVLNTMRLLPLTLNPKNVDPREEDLHHANQHLKQALDSLRRAHRLVERHTA